MSAQAGIFYFDGRPIDPALPNRLDEQLADFGPEGSGRHVAAGLVMVHRALHVTREDRLERQPYVSPRGNVMTWDGRLDNREDLLFQLWRDLRDDTTDVAIAMAAYDKWGEAGFARLIGDWSLTLWDGSANELKLASDYMGARGLYFHVDAHRVMWCTTLAGIVELANCRDDLEPSFLAGWLCGAVPPDLTPYTNVRAVSPAHALSWPKSGEIRRRRFWQFAVNTVRYSDGSQYAEQLRSVFGDAVAARLRTAGTAWATLSGGLDSTSVVCMADALIRRQRVEARDLETISWISDSSPEADERRFAACVEEQRGRRGHYVRMEDAVESFDRQNVWVTPQFSNGVMLATLRLVRSNGGRVLLTGRAGDAVMGNFVEFPELVTDLAGRGRVLGALSAARGQAAAARATVWRVGVEALRAAGPASFQWRRRAQDALEREKAARGSEDERFAEAFLLRPAFAESWRGELARRARALVQFPPAMRPILDSLIVWAEARTLQTPLDCPGVVDTHPYTYRPLVELMLAVPPELLCPPGRPRFVMKEAFGCFIPPRIAARFSKGYAAPFVARAIRTAVLQWLSEEDDIRVVQIGLVDRDRLRAKLAAVAGGSAREIGALIAVTRLEQWLRARETNGASDLARAG